ncbi:hypothetical protein TNCV_2274721 [Trichonephila clavipes]|nr:hypothetical protein TNCV_2274721 [Trichonephila clavipes]
MHIGFQSARWCGVEIKRMGNLGCGLCSVVSGHGLELMVAVVESRLRVLMPLKTHREEGMMQANSLSLLKFLSLALCDNLERGDSSGVTLIT